MKELYGSDKCEIIENGIIDIYRVKDRLLPDKTYIICDESGSDILFSPWLCGKELREKTSAVSKSFLEAAFKLKSFSSSICEVVILSGGLGYGLWRAFEDLFNKSLPICFLGIKRIKTRSGWTAKLDYKNLEALPRKKGVVLIGDTIATGSSLEVAIDAIIKEVENLDSLIIFSVAGSIDGAKRLKIMGEKLKDKWPNFNLFLFFNEAIFGLLPNGTSMRFFHPNTVMPESAINRVKKNYGFFLGREMNAIFDWGYRCNCVSKHIEEFLDFCEELKTKANPDDKRKLDGFIKKAKVITI